MIALAVESLLQLGLSDFQMDIGQVDFFKGLIEEAGLNEEQSESLRHLIDQKNSLALEMQLKELSIPADIKNNLLRIPMLFGDEEVIQSAMALAKSERCTRALQNIDQVFRLLEKYACPVHCNRPGHGAKPQLLYSMIFRGMIRDMGYPVCAGGRYDTWFQNSAWICLQPALPWKPGSCWLPWNDRRA